MQNNKLEKFGLTKVRPKKLGFNEERLSQAWRIIETGGKDGAFAGAVALVVKEGRIVLHKACGFQTTIPRPKKLRRDFIFDLASVTKAIVTTTSILILVERGKISLDTNASSIIPLFGGAVGNNKALRDKVTVRNLLTHTSGLPDWYEFYSKVNDKEDLIRELCKVPLASAPSTKFEYSDLGFILLGVIVEKVSGKDLASFSKEKIFSPLRMVDTCFNPPTSSRKRIAATEFSNWRGRMVHGEVHDENAYAMGGVSGHAGLFSTAIDLAKFCQCLLDGTFGDVRLLSDKTIQLMRTNQTGNLGGYVGLGWRVKSEVTPDIGKKLSSSAFGHSGYTGTSVWMDPENTLTIILLTNRVHPVRDGDPSNDKSVGIMMRRKSNWKQVNQAFQDKVMDSISS